MPYVQPGSANMKAWGQQAGQRHQRQHIAAVTAAACLLCMLACINAAEAALLNQRPGNVLTMIVTDCGKYQEWQTVAAAFAWRQSGQPGSAVRVATCDEKVTNTYEPLKLVNITTHMAKSVSKGSSSAC